MDTNKNTKKFFYIIVLTVLFILLLSLFSLFICTHDDYYIPYGKTALGSIQYAMNIGNGRFLGNFLGNYYSQRGFINYFIKSLALLGIIVFSAYISSDFSIFQIIVSCLLFVFPSAAVFAQCYVWSHGFYNYVIPIFFMLFSCSLLKNIYFSYSKTKAIIFSFIISILGFVQMLFSENTSIVFLIISFLLYCYFFKSPLHSLSAYYWIASILGIGVLFLMPRLIGVEKNDDFYRSTSFNIYSIIDNYINIVVYILSKFFLIWSAIISAITIKYKEIKNGKKLLLIFLFISYFIIALFFFKLLNISNRYMTFLCSVSLIIYVLCVLYWIRVLFAPAEFAYSCIIVFVCILSCAQLLFVSPIGPRCLYITYTLLVLFTLRLFNQININNYVVICSCSIFFAIYFSLFVKFKEINSINKTRLTFINEQMDLFLPEVSIIQLPTAELLWFPNESYAYGYTFFYSKPNDIIFRYITYEDYLSRYSNNGYCP